MTKSIAMDTATPLFSPGKQTRKSFSQMALTITKNI